MASTKRIVRFGRITERADFDVCYQMWIADPSVSGIWQVSVTGQDVCRFKSADEAEAHVHFVAPSVPDNWSSFDFTDGEDNVVSVCVAKYSPHTDNPRFIEVPKRVEKVQKQKSQKNLFALLGDASA